MKAVLSVGKNITKPDTRSSTQTRRHISSAEEDTSEIEKVKNALKSIQETLRNTVTKDDIRDTVKSVMVDFKNEIKKEIQQN